MRATGLGFACRPLQTGLISPNCTKTRTSVQTGFKIHSLRLTRVRTSVRADMKGRIILALFLAVAAAGCAGAKREKEPEIPEVQVIAVRSLVPRIEALTLEPTASGAIVHVTGLPLKQGYHGGELVPVGEETVEDGVLNYEFRITSPSERTPEGTRKSREVIAARFISKRTLDEVTRIRVISASNALSVRP